MRYPSVKIRPDTATSFVKIKERGEIMTFGDITSYLEAHPRKPLLAVAGVVLL